MRARPVPFLVNHAPEVVEPGVRAARAVGQGQPVGDCRVRFLDNSHSAFDNCMTLRLRTGPTLTEMFSLLVKKQRTISYIGENAAQECNPNNQ